MKHLNRMKTSIIRGNIVDVIQRKIYKGEIHFTNKIVNIIEKTVDENIYILPGLINAHVHIESSMLSPRAFSKYAIKHGTIAVIADPHEIANVCGIDGLNFMLENAKQSPLKIFFGVPSCVPATNYETSGAIIDSQTVDNLLSTNDYYFLSEMMNFPGVINNDPEVIAKINFAKKHNKPIDGHAPFLSGEDLKKYINIGISTDHECSTLDEAKEKIALGMKIHIREGSAAKNFNALHHLIDISPDNIMFCTDDSHPDDLIEGHINSIVRNAWHLNHNYFNTLRAATFVPIKHYRLPVGLIQVGDFADFVIAENQYYSNIKHVFINGVDALNFNFSVENIKNINRWNPSTISKNDLSLSFSNNNSVNVIECIDGELYTKHLKLSINDIFNSDGSLKSGFDKIIVVNRYLPSKPVIGIIKNVNLQDGAFGGTIAHDSHNIIICGHNDDDMIQVFNELYENSGGISASLNNTVLSLPLPIGGLMTHEDGLSVALQYNKLQSFVKEVLGCTLTSPFMTLSFMALLVIPELKISDKGLFNILDLKFYSLFE